MPSSFVVYIFMLSLICALFILLPLWRRRSSGNAGFALVPVGFALLTLAGAYFLYLDSSEWNWQDKGVPNNPGAQQLYQLQQAVHEDANNHKAWLSLGQFYLQFEQIAPSRDALNRAFELTRGRDIDTNLALVELLSVNSGPQDAVRISELITASLKIDPGHRKALWYGGEVAASQQKFDVAIARWSLLLDESRNLNTPEAQSVTNLLQERIASARAALQSPQPPTQAQPSAPETIVVQAMLGPGKEQNLSPSTPVFVLARAQGQAGPPLAVHRTRVESLPLTVKLSDESAMLPTRKLSDFEQVEIVVRVALGGAPTATTGDLFGNALVGPQDERSVTIVIDQVQP